MFCSNCGTQSKDGAKFCPGCGAVLGNNVQANVAVQSADWANTGLNEQEEVIDLTGQTELNKPREKKHKGTIITGICLSISWIAVAIISFLLCVVFEGYPEQDEVMGRIALIALPIGIIGLILVFSARKKANLTCKVKKSESFLFYAYTICMAAFSFASGFGGSFFTMGLGLGQMIVNTLLFVMSIMFLVLCVIYSGQNGAEGMFSILTGAFVGYLIAPLTAYALGMLIAAMEFMFMIIIILVVLFFAMGGRIFYVRRY